MSTLNLKTIKIATSVILVTCTIAILYAAYQSAQQGKAIQRDYSIERSWKMPRELDEISGIAWMSNQLMACIQDEDGVVFIYDLDKQKVVKQIPFNKPGDYEAIAVKEEDAYVMRSDGVIFKIANYNSDSNPAVTSFDTGFTKANNMETLTLSLDSTSLITAPKDLGRRKNFKGLYRIDIDSQKVSVGASLSLDMKDEAFKLFMKEKRFKTFSPSDAAFHPLTSDVYIIEGIKPKLIIVDSNGLIKRVIEFKSNQFRQPEGIAISPEGRLFIANEADGGVGTIVEISID